MDVHDCNAVLYIPAGRETDDVSVHSIQIQLGYTSVQRLQNVSVDSLCDLYADGNTVDEQSAGIQRYGESFVSLCSTLGHTEDIVGMSTFCCLKHPTPTTYSIFSIFVSRELSQVVYQSTRIQHAPFFRFPIFNGFISSSSL